MTYDQSPNPYIRPQFDSPPAQPPSDGSKKILNMSASMFILAVTAVVVLCCGLPLLLCGMGIVATPFMPDPTLSPTP